MEMSRVVADVNGRCHLLMDVISIQAIEIEDLDKVADRLKGNDVQPQFAWIKTKFSNSVFKIDLRQPSIQKARQISITKDDMRNIDYLINNWANIRYDQARRYKPGEGK